MNKLKILLVSLLMVCLLVPAASADNPYSEEEQQMLDLINQEREENGLDPLRFNPLLNDVASDHSQEMIEKDYFSHNSYDGSSFFKRIKGSGYESYTFAENIAFRTPPSVTMAHEGLMNSPGHRANILNSKYNEIGIGIWVGEFKYNGRTYSNSAMYTQNFGWGEPTTEPIEPVEPVEPVKPVGPVYPPKINNYSPTNAFELDVGDVQEFSITTTDNCDITWTVNGVEIRKDISVKSSSYENTVTSSGKFTVKVIAENENGIDSKEWTWTVTEKEGFDPMYYDSNSDGLISRLELNTAFSDYYGKNIIKAELMEVISIYFSSK